ncbi:MAG: dolichyl-phosphate-mannose-protein mannosyltransferase [Frankiaceae bacterium]|jgi:dolichyl-phosphate-mannose--protein O-mannosyl transferase|nr:dolichyl-phosphate-mannose-protein mannosyltransferase [Frankiaceae bacterium]
MVMTDVLPAHERVVAREPRPLWQEIPGSRLVGWLGPLGVAVFALLLRIHNLAVPAKAAFDEVYYACDAQMLWKYGYEHAHLKDNVCVVDSTTTGAGFVVHPPLGKWLIAIGEWIYGYDPNGGARSAFGWRISACVVGALSVLVLCRLGRRLFRSTLLGCFAGLLLALDGLHFVQSRMAMLDIFLMFFVVAAAACLVADRDWGRRRLQQRLTEDRSFPGPWLGARPWRIAAAVLLGLALGTKWSAVYHVPIFLLVAYAWDVGARRAAGIRKPFRAALLKDGLYALGIFVVLPFVAYVATWTGWFVTDGGWRRTCGERYPTSCGPVAGFIKYHREILDFHVHLHSPHPYASKPWGWLVLARPVLYVYETPAKGTSQAVLAIGTPAIWWASVLALLGCVWGWISRRDWRAAFILAGFAVGYLPWFWPPDRTEFFFYALPALPFLCLALAYVAGLVLGPPDASPTRRHVGVTIVGAYALLVVLNFFWLYPVLAAKVIPYGSWHSRMWFSSWI